jgi:hypothetical protein
MPEREQIIKTKLPDNLSMFRPVAQILHHHGQLRYWSTTGGVIRLIPAPKRTLSEH